MIVCAPSEAFQWHYCNQSWAREIFFALLRIVSRQNENATAQIGSVIFLYNSFLYYYFFLIDKKYVPVRN